MDKYPKADLGKRPDNDDELAATMVEEGPLDDRPETMENQIRRKDRADRLRGKAHAKKQQDMIKALRGE